MENKEILTDDLQIINVGLKKFADELQKQDLDVVQVDWAPPAGGDQEMIDLLDDLI